MKKIMKLILGFVAVVFIIIVVLWGSFVYVSDYKITNVDTSVSPDETYELVLGCRRGRFPVWFGFRKAGSL